MSKFSRSITQTKQNLLKIKSLLDKNSKDGLQGFLAKVVTGTLGLKIVNAFLGYVISILLARFLGAEGYGIYAYALAWIMLLKIPAMLGLPPLIIRELAVYQTNSNLSLSRGLLRWSNQIVLATSIGLALIAAGVANYLSSTDSENLWVIWMAMACLPLVALSQLRQAALQSLRYILRGQIPELLFNPVLLITGFYTVYLLSGNKLTPFAAMAVYAAAMVITFLIGSNLLNRSLPRQFKNITPQHQTNVWIKAALPMLFINGMYIINNQADMIMLGAIKDPVAVGIYTIANRAAGLIAFVLVAFNTSLAPVFASLYAEGNKERLQKVITKSSRLILLAALPIALCLIIFRQPFLLLFGEKFLEAQTTLIILCLGQLFNAFTGSVAVLLNMTGHQNDTAIGVGVSAVLNIILNFLLIPRWDAAGAATATTSSAIIWNVLLIFLVYKRLKIYPTAIGKLN